MDKSVQLFQFQEQPVQVIMIEGEPWWIASDVCKILELRNVSQAVIALDEDEKLTYTLHISGQNRKVLLINEPGLYALVIVSRKPQAKDFKRWLTHEVLPSIRKTGKYEVSLGTPSVEHRLSKLLADRAEANRKRVPRHFFSILGAFHALLYAMECLNGDLDAEAKIEISVGLMWAKYAREVLHIPDCDKTHYQHILPNGQAVQAWAYSHKWMGDFENWLKDVYMPEHYPNYKVYRNNVVKAIAQQ